MGVIQTFPICGEFDNSNELLMVKCNACDAKSSGTRFELQLNGWRHKQDSMFDFVMFNTCPECTPKPHAWEDLY